MKKLARASQQRNATSTVIVQALDAVRREADLLALFVDVPHPSAEWHALARGAVERMRRDLGALAKVTALAGKAVS